MVQRLNGCFEKKDVNLVDWKIQEAPSGMCDIWTKASSHDAMPSWAIWWIKILSSNKVHCELSVIKLKQEEMKKALKSGKTTHLAEWNPSIQPYPLNPKILYWNFPIEEL